MKLAFVFLSVLAACASPPQKPAAPAKTDIVFMHGSHFDASSWDRVQEHMPLDRRTTMLSIPHRTLAPELTLGQAAQRACSETLRPSIFVVHSFAGVIAHQMLSFCPEKMKQLIYVAGVVTLPGERPVVTFSAADQERYAQAVDISDAWLTPRERGQFFGVMAGPRYEADAVFPPIFRESAKMMEEKVNFDFEVWQKLPKNYVYTLEDQVISAESQEAYAAKAQIVKTRALQSGHVPMLTHPEYLADAILELVSE
jgi:pimeloyl-ACP methyl ester carboxylesterase